MVEKVFDRAVAFSRIRECEDCGEKWTTIEVPLYSKTRWPCRGDRCPDHPDVYSDVLCTATPDRLLTGKYSNMTTELALSWGAVYRRRKCRQCGDGWTKEKPVGRWTTFEVASSATVVEDVTKCPRCGGLGPIKRKGRPAS
jgi:ribosomal protein S27AE